MQRNNFLALGSVITGLRLITGTKRENPEISSGLMSLIAWKRILQT